MTRLPKKLLLSQLYLFEPAIESKLEQIAKLDSMITSAGAAFGSSGGGGSGSGHNYIESINCSLIDLKDVVQKDIELLTSTKKELNKAFNETNRLEYSYILNERYFNNKTIPEIASNMKKSEDRVYILYGEAIKDLIIPDETYEKLSKMVKIKPKPRGNKSK